MKRLLLIFLLLSSNLFAEQGETIQIHFNDLIEFSPEDKTITLYFSGETCSSAYEYYQGAVGNRGVKFRPIKRWDYWFLKDDGNVVPCDLATYDIVNDREVLNLTGSGTVDEVWFFKLVSGASVFDT
jgi:hypothetical protein